MTFSGLFLYFSTTLCQFCFTAQVRRVSAAMYQRHGAFRSWLVIHIKMESNASMFKGNTKYATHRYKIRGEKKNKTNKRKTRDKAIETIFYDDGLSKYGSDKFMRHSSGYLLTPSVQSLKLFIAAKF